MDLVQADEISLTWLMFGTNIVGQSACSCDVLFYVPSTVSKDTWMKTSYDILSKILTWSWKFDRWWLDGLNGYTFTLYISMKIKQTWFQPCSFSHAILSLSFNTHILIHYTKPAKAYQHPNGLLNNNIRPAKFNHYKNSWKMKTICNSVCQTIPDFFLEDFI